MDSLRMMIRAEPEAMQKKLETLQNLNKLQIDRECVGSDSIQPLTETL
ncbi:unnamed protein product, partial [Brassica oleracea]